MLPDPERATRIVTFARRAVWLVMAYAFGSMVGHLILLVR
jgi:hypothetical protein